MQNNDKSAIPLLQIVSNLKIVSRVHLHLYPFLITL